jgi:hypothetical protein
MLALGMRSILSVTRQHGDKVWPASKSDKAPQTASPEGFPSLSVDNEFSRELEAAGNKPATYVDVSHCN